MLKFVDAEHAAALPRRGVPGAISGARPMIKGAGVHASWSRCSTSSKVRGSHVQALACLFSFDLCAVIVLSIVGEAQHLWLCVKVERCGRL